MGEYITDDMRRRGHHDCGDVFCGLCCSGEGHPDTVDKAQKTAVEDARKQRQLIRGRIAFLIADGVPTYDGLKLDSILKIVDVIMTEFQVSRRRGSR